MSRKDRVSDGVCTGMRGLSPLFALAAGLVLAAPAVAADHIVSYHSYQYSPDDVTIAAHDTVTFSADTSEDFTDHPLVLWNGSAYVTTNTGSSKQATFPAPGTYPYYCQLHVNNHNMKGTIRVVDQHPANVSFAVSSTPRVGQPVTFTYNGDPDPDGTLTSWQWDLDGDGAFETTTSAGAATRTYATPATVTVRMRAVDDSGEPSAAAEQAVTIAAAGSGGSGTGGSGGGASGTKDTTAPRATVVKLSGLKLSFHSSERATATATLRARGKTIARGTAKPGTTTIRLRLTTVGRARLHRGHKLRATLTLTLRDNSGNARKLTRTLTVRRP
jgi:plastocyanin